MKKAFVNTDKLSKINTFRASQGLELIVPKKTADKKQQRANRSAHSEKCREIKALRTSGKKSK
jgi:hypothetical protein